jgi:hypothetical protein
MIGYLLAGLAEAADWPRLRTGLPRLTSCVGTWTGWPP